MTEDQLGTELTELQRALRTIKDKKRLTQEDEYDIRGMENRYQQLAKQLQKIQREDIALQRGQKQ